MYVSVFKPIFDYILACILTLLTTPLILVLIPLVKLNSKGPFIYKQIRIGRNCQEFTIFKIRTMTYNPKNEGNFSTSSNDSRITSIGKFLRLSSLDELPQLWNILLGHMSLIGPRPDLPVQKNMYTHSQWQMRHHVKPGITGLAQATLRSSGTNKARTSLDLFYVKKICFELDILICFRTVRILLKKGVQN